MKKSINIFALLLAVATTAICQVPIPAKDQDKPVLLTGATAHIGDGTVIENAAIGFDKGKLTIVSSKEDADASGYEVIDVAGKHIYPGFILPNSAIGLQEVSSIRAMSDYNERGSFNPNIRSVISYNTDSEFIPTFRFNGVLLAESTPQGGLVAGSSSLMEMEGWNWEDAVHSEDIGIHMDWPGRLKWEFVSGSGWERKPDKNYDENVASLKMHFKEASAYHQSGEVGNIKLDAMKGIFDGSRRLFIHSNNAKSIIEAIRLAQSVGVRQIVLISGEESLIVAGFLKENNIGVIVHSTHQMPSYTQSGVFDPYEVPKKLFDEELKVGMYMNGMLGFGRNLPFAAGIAVGHGLAYEDAIKMITLNNAELLGVDERVGSLVVGKDASLFVSEGDALDMRTNILSHAFISGKQVTLDNRQQELYKRFSDKYGHTTD